MRITGNGIPPSHEYFRHQGRRYRTHHLAAELVFPRIRIEPVPVQSGLLEVKLSSDAPKEDPRDRPKLERFVPAELVYPSFPADVPLANRGNEVVFWLDEFSRPTDSSAFPILFTNLINEVEAGDRGFAGFDFAGGQTSLVFNEDLFDLLARRGSIYAMMLLIGSPVQSPPTPPMPRLAAKLCLSSLNPKACGILTFSEIGSTRRLLCFQLRELFGQELI